MIVIRLLLKILMLPIALCFWAIKWAMGFLTAMSGWVFNLLAGLMLTIGLACLLFATAAWKEVVPLWCASFVIFMITYFGEWLTGVCANVSQGLGNFIRS